MYDSKLRGPDVQTEIFVEIYESETEKLVRLILKHNVLIRLNGLSDRVLLSEARRNNREHVYVGYLSTSRTPAQRQNRFE